MAQPIIQPMHLVLPFASAMSPSAAHAATTLTLPHLERLLARLTAGPRLAGEELSLSAPHERVLAELREWPWLDGLLPTAAEAARRDGLAPAPGSGWGLLSPSHWHLGTEQVSLTNPAALQLDEATSRQLFDAVKFLFEDDGWRLHWGAPSRWYAEHDSLATLPTASLDRVVGRNVDLWLTMQVEGRRIRRLQAEVQMLLYTHAVNEQREAQGLKPVNSFWLSGTGPAAPPAAGPDTWQVLDGLREPALAEDWAAWAEAWQAIDAGPMRELLAEALAGRPAQLTLCGERHAQHFAAQPRPWWRSGLLARQRVAAAPLLAEL